MAAVASVEARESFGQYREAALEEPLIVTGHGKPSVAIISIDKHERLKGLDRRVMRLDEMDNAQIEEMVAAETRRGWPAA